MASSTRKVVIDTYAIMADILGEASPRASAILEDVRRGRIEGVIHYLTVFELAYHWKKGRLPFRDEYELLSFVNVYFTLEELTPELAIEAAKVKLLGDKLLQESCDVQLRRRRLSIADATTIAVARKHAIPIVTGDKDLMYVAQKLGVEVVW